MQNRIRTINFLPEVFQTKSNKEVLGATLDQLVNPPVTMRVQGNIGSKFGYGINSTDYYVPEPTKIRTDYQLEPGVIIRNTDSQTVKDALTYPGLVDSFSILGAKTQNNSRMFESDIYSWDSFVDFDKLINFSQYYWLPTGLPAVSITSDTTLNVNEILLSSTFTSENGVVFTNGLKVAFGNNVTPEAYANNEYYVEGVGTRIQLVAVTDLVCPEDFTSSEFIPYDSVPYDTTNYDANLFIPVEHDYITIARNSLDKNAWSRSNRWFHIAVINATAQYLNDPSIATEHTKIGSKAKRPIIEFYPNLKLINTGVVGKKPIDFIDQRNTNAFANVQGLQNYFPDIQVWTNTTTDIASAVATTNTTITVPTSDISGKLAIGQYVSDYNNVLPVNTIITDIVEVSGTTTITVEWGNNRTFTGVTNVAIVASDLPTDGYQVFTGARVLFANDSDPSVRNKIYTVNIATVNPSLPPVITLSEDDDAECFENDQLVVLRGYYNQGNSFWFDGIDWIYAQEKTTVNQSPLYDVFDKDGISFSDSSVYVGTTFNGCKLFSFGFSEGQNDPVLGFPIRYDVTTSSGDISFDVNINTDTFTYVDGQTSFTGQTRNGFVREYTTRTEYVNNIGWIPANAPSQQYQVFMFDYKVGNNPVFTCDIPALPNDRTENWASIQVLTENKCMCTTQYTYAITDSETIITFSKAPITDTKVHILLLSEQTSDNAYYEIPLNLSNNPLNQDLTKVNIGDIRRQYRDIYLNAPGIVGQVFGSNNYRDLGRLAKYGYNIIQNSASLAIPMALQRTPDCNIVNAIKFNSIEYSKFKALLVETLANVNYDRPMTSSELLDMAMDTITSTKTSEQAFFWSDMLPCKTPFRVNTYLFNNTSSTSTFPLYELYDSSKASYNSVLVYLSNIQQGVIVEEQLLKGRDYYFSEDSAVVVVTKALNPGDNIIVKEYNQSFGSFVPNTPSKLGLYPVYEPMVVLDNAYTIPTYFIRGHDGSYTKLYGDYVGGMLVDLRDRGLLEFESRIYNNIKLKENALQDIIYDVVPGLFRETKYSYEEYLDMYSECFLDWTGQNRITYKTQQFNQNNDFTFNYAGTQNKLTKGANKQGNWRGLYLHIYDTSTPHTSPWEMLGFTDIPSWWETRYGSAPYTKDNLVLWNDLEAGLIWNNGNSYIDPKFVRPGLTDIIPVGSDGNLISPFEAVVGNYNPNIFRKDWNVGDFGPAEFSYRRNSTYAFDIVRLYAMMFPAKFFNLAVDLDNYYYDSTMNQYLVDSRSHLTPDTIQVYGSGIAKTSYLNWIVDYQKQIGIDATANITNLLQNLDVGLMYRLAGFSDKEMLRFYIENVMPDNTNSTALIPDESYSLLLYDNQPYDTVKYSSVLIQRTVDGYLVFGNSQTNAYFTTLTPIQNGQTDTITVENLTVTVPKSFSSEQTVVPYGTKFYTVQDVTRFLVSYAEYLKSQGMLFNIIERGVEITWEQMSGEFLYWAQTGWTAGSIVTLNPSAYTLKINRENMVVRPLVIDQTNFILNQNLYPIQLKNLSVARNGTEFEVTALNQGDALSYCQFDLSNLEHIVIFDNFTIFGDTIYNPVTGIRQNRMKLSGTKTAEWNGTMNASGFIINQDNVKEWSKSFKYPKGSIVKYKNKYWTALDTIEQNVEFSEQNWVITDYSVIQKGLLPNASTRAYESTLYYNTNVANLEKDADQLGYSLIGYRPRDYLAIANLSDVTQINVYKSMIENKGTKRSLDLFNNVNLMQGIVEYDLYENWAIKTSDYGSVLDNNFVEFNLDENKLTRNPTIVSLTEGVYTPGSQQEVPLYKLLNYSYAISDPDILPTTVMSDITKLPNAGFVNFNDVKMSSYSYQTIASAVNELGSIVPISNFYLGDYVWFAEDGISWDVETWTPVGQVIEVRSNLNNTAVVVFSDHHNLQKGQRISIVNFANSVDGYYTVRNIQNLFEITIDLSLPPAITISGQGVCASFVSHREETPSDISNRPTSVISNNEKIWVNQDVDGSWAVYERQPNYSQTEAITRTNSDHLGNSVLYVPNVGYLVADADKGEVYRYIYRNNQFVLGQTITNGISFGSDIVASDNFIYISEPLNGLKVRVYVYNDTLLSSQTQLCQEISAPMGVTNWGSSIAISGTRDWLYISDLANTKVYVYRKQNIEYTAGYFVSGQTYTITSVGTTDFTLIGAVENKVGITFTAAGAGIGTGTAMNIMYQESNVIDGTVHGLIASDKFGFDIATNFFGDSVFISAPEKDYSVSVEDRGIVYAYDRLLQTIEVNNTTEATALFSLGWTPATHATRTASQVASNVITANASMTGFAINDPVVFTGTNFGDTGIIEYRTYYINSISGNTFTIKESRSASGALVLTNDTGLSMNVHVQITPAFVYKNGTLQQDNVYCFVGNNLAYTGGVMAGDTIIVSSNQFVYSQTLESDNTTRPGSKFGYAVTTNRSANELLIGSPFEISDTNYEGIVYRYTNLGGKFGLLTGKSECNITTNRTIFLNGYLVNLAAGNATSVANTINSINIPNIRAAAANNRIIIQLINRDIARVGAELLITATTITALQELGIEKFTNTQKINSPNHPNSQSQFGTSIAINDKENMFVVGAPVENRIINVEFDGMILDNGMTAFNETSNEAGMIHIFEYMGNYSEHEYKIGQYAYAQSLNDDSVVYGNNPRFGEVVSYVDNTIMVGSPNFLPENVDGKVTIFTNIDSISVWNPVRKPSIAVDTESLTTVQLFNNETNDTAVYLDYIDPLNGKLFGVVRESLNYISETDPAGYKGTSGKAWGESELGKTWFDTSRVKFVDYHQDDLVYNSVNWGKIFPGSDVAVYTWVVSNRPPQFYPGPGTPRNVNEYVEGKAINSTDTISPVYYFWVRNSNIILNNKLSDSIIEQYIRNPLGSGIAYMTPLSPRAFGLYNIDSYLSDSTAMHIGYSKNKRIDNTHKEFVLIKQDSVDDFLPGLPTTTNTSPSSLYERLLDSLAGVDEIGDTVPNPFLPVAVQTGVSVRPKQSFFYNRLLALKNLFEYANSILLKYPINELKPNLSFLMKQGEFFNTMDYWEYTNWWAEGYSNATKPAITVPLYADLAKLNVSNGTIVAVENSSLARKEVYAYENGWNRIGLINGTFQIKPQLWDYSKYNIGYGVAYDVAPYDSYPSEETRYIVRALIEQVYTGDLAIYKNKSLILLFEYIQSEAAENQNYLPWLTKTSLADVTHNVRELKPYTTYQFDNQDFLQGYIEETKPYHVLIKEFLSKYTGQDDDGLHISDFDLPAVYDPETLQYMTPMLTYGIPNASNQFTADNSIWQNFEFNDWFENRGIGLYPQESQAITVITKFIDFGTSTISVDNIYGFPVTGVIQIDEERMSYSSVDLVKGELLGVVRGIQDTLLAPHIPGAEVFIDLPAVILTNSGRHYDFTPQVTATVDLTKYPAPTKYAELQANMEGDRVISIDVIDPGAGYMVTPEIIIEPAFVVNFSNSDINSGLHSIRVESIELQTGDAVKYESLTGSITKLKHNSWYYIRVLETYPTTVIALYETYTDALRDNSRVPFVANGASTAMICFGARASATTGASPIREITTTVRFDRTSYTSDIIDWAPGGYYGSFFAGDYLSRESLSSSTVKLTSTQPPIVDILASAHGVVFDVVEVENKQELDWSSFVRQVASTSDSNNAITLIPQDDGSGLENASGSTIGLVKNMPVRFTGAVVGGLVENIIYYVREVLSITDFTVSETIDGPEKTLTTATVSIAGMGCEVAQHLNVAIVHVNYPGILTVTQSNTNNVLTVPLSAIGTGGTRGFYVNLPVFFTGPVYDGIDEHEVYYINTIIDIENFTISKKENPITNTILASSSSTDIINLQNVVDGFNVNDPIMFTDIVISGTPATQWGNIQTGVVYYVSELVGATSIRISNAINGMTFDPGNISADPNTHALITNQKDTVMLQNEDSTMTMNVSLPVSPGQVDGQRFSFYNTSPQYPGITATVTETIARELSHTIATVNRIVVTDESGGTSGMYVNMPVVFDDSPIGSGITDGTTYYVIEYSGMEVSPGVYAPNIQVTVTDTTTGTNLLTCDTTDSLYVDMPIVFTGNGIGGITITNLYYVLTIDSATEFTISTQPGGAPFVVTTGTGSMVGTGSAWFTVSATVGGSPLTLTDAAGDFVLEQDVLQSAEFSISNKLGGYFAIIEDGGEGFAVGNKLTIAGNLIGGTTPANDLTMIVNTIDSTGAITDVICSGLVPLSNSSYYLKVIDESSFEVYQDAILVTEQSGLDFPYTGFTVDSVVSMNATSDSFVLIDSSKFAVNDEVVFTGTIPSGASIVKGNSYFIVSNNTGTNTIQVSAMPAGSPINITSTDTVDFTIAKAGSFAFLPEPFYFTQSIVKFNNRLYACLISNNDNEFVFGKWQVLESSDRRLNAMDRVMGYYEPTDDMPGKDLTQLFANVTYPNNVYKGQAFEPDQQYPLDATLIPQAFSPESGALVSSAFDGSDTIIFANFSGVSGFLTNDSDTWTINQLTNQNINITDSIFADGMYIVTAKNAAVPVFRSGDLQMWSAAGTVTLQNGATIDIGSLGMLANSVAYNSGTNQYAIVGNKILDGMNPVQWNERVTLNTANELYDITAVNISTIFNGFVAVGYGTFTNDTVLPPEDVFAGLIYYADESGWNRIENLTTNAFYGVTASSDRVLAVGENGIIYQSPAAQGWFGVNETLIRSMDEANDRINLVNASGYSLDDCIRVTDMVGGLSTGTDYYIIDVDNDPINPSIQVSTSIGGPAVTLTDTAIPMLARIFIYDSTPFNNLNDVVFGNGIFVAVGDTGTIWVSTDDTGYFWTSVTSGITDNLLNIRYENNLYTVVGENSTILESTDAINWTKVSSIIETPPFYTIIGDSFNYGYGPEELVPGYVTDNLVITMNTKPGSTWPVTEFQHVGFGVKSITIEPSNATQLVYSFVNLSQYPSAVKVSVIAASTGLATTLIEGIDYDIDWVSETVVLNSPLNFGTPSDKVFIEVYEVGNGNQLVRSSSRVDPLITNSQTGFSEIVLNCNYSGEIYSGGGIVRPNSFAIGVTVTDTESTNNTMTCDSVADLTLNSPIIFQGTVFGGVVTGTEYYVKTISTSTNTITISDTFNPITGITGSTFNLTDDTGSMLLIVQNGTASVYNEPAVYHNGEKLTRGLVNTVIRTKASNNAITTLSTDGLFVDMPIVFSENIMPASNLVPSITYYVESIVNANEFTVSETQGGSVKTLGAAVGNAWFITNEFAIGTVENSLNAKLIFAGQLNTDDDYVMYSILGESDPSQIGYSVPETEIFIADGVSDTFTLSNYVDQANAYAAIVEVNGLRLLPVDYTVNSFNNELQLSFVPNNDDIVSVTTFNNTINQCLNTNVFTVGSDQLVSKIVSISNNIQLPLASTRATASTVGGTNAITVDSTTGFLENATVLFKGGSFDANILADGTVYFVDTILSATEFTIKDESGTQITTAGGTGTMLVEIGGQPAIRVTTSSAHGFTENELVNIDDTVGSVQLNGDKFYAKVIDSFTFDLYEFGIIGNSGYDPALGAINYPVTSITTYISGGYTWKSNAFNVVLQTATASSAATDALTVTSSTGFIVGMPVQFVGTPIGGLSTGVTYYVLEIPTGSELTVSLTAGGNRVTLTDDIGSMDIVPVWEYTNPDRLWITINGYRVPTDSIRLVDNEIAILTEVTNGDEIIITNMMPTELPDNERYMLFVDKDSQSAVYRANANTRTWLTQTLYDTSTSVTVDDVTKLTQAITQTVITSIQDGDEIVVGLSANKRDISSISVFNISTNQEVSTTDFRLAIEDMSPVLKINDSVVSLGDSLEITILEGTTMFISGEQIGFTTVDFNTNTISGLKRGINGTITQLVIPVNTQVYGLLEKDKLNDSEYNKVWNSFNYSASGDPLQLSNTPAAEFLKG